MPTRAEDIAAFARWFDDAPRSTGCSTATPAVSRKPLCPTTAVGVQRPRLPSGLGTRPCANYRDADSYYRDGLAHHGNTAHIATPAAAFADTERLFIASKNRLARRRPASTR
jgi:hypothetical protein